GECRGPNRPVPCSTYFAYGAVLRTPIRASYPFGNRCAPVLVMLRKRLPVRCGTFPLAVNSANAAVSEITSWSRGMTSAAFTRSLNSVTRAFSSTKNSTITTPPCHDLDTALETESPGEDSVSVLSLVDRLC